MYYAAKDRGFGDFLPHASSMSEGHGRVTLGTVCSLRWGPPRPRGRLSQSPPRRDKQPLFQDRPRLWPPEGGPGAGTDSWSEERVSGGLQKSEEVLFSPGVQMTFQGCTWGTTVFSASEQRYGSHRVLPGVDLGVAGEKENKIVLWFSAVTNLGRARRAVSLMPPGNRSQVWTFSDPRIVHGDVRAMLYEQRDSVQWNLCWGFVITVLFTSLIKCWTFPGWNVLNYSRGRT